LASIPADAVDHGGLRAAHNHHNDHQTTEAKQVGTTIVAFHRNPQGRTENLATNRAILDFHAREHNHFYTLQAGEGAQ
jgi:hypothetical protein